MTVSITAGAEIQVNTDTSGIQMDPKIVQLSNGDFIVVWIDSDASSGSWGVMGQLLDSNGNKVGGEFLINSTSGAEQDQIDVAALSTGGFAVTWTDPAGDSSGSGIMTRVFDDSGTAVTGDLHVNSLTVGQQWSASMTALSGGQYLVMWQDDHADGSGYAAEGQIFDANGNKVGGEFQINQTTQGYENAAQAVPLAGGGFVITWNEESFTGGADPSGYCVKARIYDANGNPVTNEFLVNTATGGDQGAEHVAALAGGGFVVAWYDNGGSVDHSGIGVMAQMFDASGNKVGGEFLVNTNTTGDQFPTSVIGLPSGGFIVAWNDSTGDSDGYASKAQMFDADGNKVGGEILLNQTTAGAEVNPDLVATETGFAAVWNGGTGYDGNLFHDIYFRSFALGEADTTPPDAPTGLADSAIHNGYVNAANDTAAQTLTGNAEAGSTVTVYDGTTSLGTTVGGSDGSWSFTLGALADGSHSLTATATDAASNVSSASNPLSFIVDTAAPGAPGSLAYDTSTGALTGVAEAGTTVSVFDSGTLAGTTIAGSDGRWAFSADPSAAHNFIANATDAAGNIGAFTNHVITGTPTDDTFNGTAGNDLMYGGGGNDWMVGLRGDDTLYGGNGDDALIGRLGNDALYGGAGNDFLRGDATDVGAATAGNDYLDGGSGFDRVAFFNTVNGVTVSLLLQGTPQDTGQGMDTLVNIEAVSGTPFNDTLIGDDNDNWLLGSSAGLDGRTLTSDTLIGNGGNDLIQVAMGNHTIDGGSGNDTLGLAGESTGGFTVSLTQQGAAQNTGQGSMTITGIENLSGSVYNDTFLGDGGNNVLAGGAGSDVLYGAAGNDVLLGDGEINILIGALGGSGPIHTFQSEDYSGIDFYDASGQIVYFFQGQDLYDSAGNKLERTDLVDDSGDTYSHFVLNGVGYDFYANRGDGSSDTGSDGLPGNDILIGGDGDDVLIGGGGADSLYGGNGHDTFVYLSLTDSKVGAADTINDFDEKSDHLDFTAIDANTKIAGHQDFTYVKAFTGAGGEIVASYDGKAKVTHLLFDVNGDKVADMQIDLSGNHTNLSQLAAATLVSPPPAAAPFASASLADPVTGGIPADDPLLQAHHWDYVMS